MSQLLASLSIIQSFLLFFLFCLFTSSFLVCVIIELMAHSTFIQLLDRHSVHSVLRGSTSTICGIIGTLIVMILCLAIYIPPIHGYLEGNYFESQFFTQQKIRNDFYSTEDFKIAIQFRSKTDNSVADHKEITNWAYATFGEITADFANSFEEQAYACRRDYFADAINPIQLQDCFIFPDYANFMAFAGYGVITDYSAMFYWLFSMPSADPLAQASGGKTQLMQNLQKNYYYIVYFTSKLVDPRSGKPQFQINRFYSTDTMFNSLGGGADDTLIYSVKKTHLDNSIMPWINNVTVDNLVWMGQQNVYRQRSVQSAASYGIQVQFTLDKYQIQSYRYYKKLDWLLAIIGGAYLLFYLILWVPCHYINKTIHQMSNVNQLLLINHTLQQGQPPNQSTLDAANVSKWYWVSNWFMNKLKRQCYQASKIVRSAREELDIVRLVRKLKVTQRMLRKKQYYQPFKPKILNMKAEKYQEIVAASTDNANSVDASRQNQPIIQQVLQQDFDELSVNPIYGIPDYQLQALKNDEGINNIYQNNMTVNAIRGNKDKCIRLMELESKDKFRANYQSKKNNGRIKKFAKYVVRIIRHFDVFGARPNLIVEPHGSSLVGCCGTFLIVLLTILTVAVTLHTAGSPQMMILRERKDQTDKGYTLKSGSTLKFAACFDGAAALKGVGRSANLRFFTQKKDKRVYYEATQLTAGDYALFDLTASESPVRLQFCFTMPPGKQVFMGAAADEDGYFGYRIEPFCPLTPEYCLLTQQTNTINFLNLINNYYSYPFLPENRFQPQNRTLKNSLIFLNPNMNVRLMNKSTSFQQTFYLDHVQLHDDTSNWFLRKDPNITFEGVTANENTPMAVSKNINSSSGLYYEMRFRPSANQINYVVQNKKADYILGIIGGVFVFWYAILHWIGKLYNNFNVRAKMALIIYDEESISQSPLNKILTIFPIPVCLIPTCIHIRSDVIRMRQIQKKIQNDLNYLWLVKYVDNIFRLSSSFFRPLEAKNLAMVFVKEKTDQSQEVKPPVELVDHLDELDFVAADEMVEQKQMKMPLSLNESHNKISNISFQQVQDEKQFQLQQQLNNQNLSNDPNGQSQNFKQNFMQGLPKQPKLNWFDTFQYQASLTFKGHSQVTSCCGGFCCILMMILICIVASFQVGVYLNRDDMKVGYTTDMMQPLDLQENGTYNNQIHLTAGKNFKLAVTFSMGYLDFPHNVSADLANVVGISIFQQIFRYHAGQNLGQTLQIPMVPCPADYFEAWLDPFDDSSYYTNMQFGYCVPDGITLEIDGLPEDLVTKRFTLSIYNKLGTTLGNVVVKNFIQKYLPVYHLSSPVPNFKEHKFDYEIRSLIFKAFNIIGRQSQNLSLSKTVVYYDDQIGFEGDPYRQQQYSFSPFQQDQTWYSDYSETFISYNLSFANSYQVETFTVQGTKFYQTFGIVGGLVAFFIFGIGYCAWSFNQYKMRYLIGRQFYLFDLLKKKEARAIARGRKRKTREENNSMNDANQMNQGQIFLAFILSFIAMASNYNLNDTLRRVTLIQRKVQNDIDLFEVYKKLHVMRDVINKHLDVPGIPVPLTDIFPKHIYNPDPDRSSLVDQTKILRFAKKHNWSAYEQWSVMEAAAASVNLKTVFDNAFLEKEFNMGDLSRNSVHMSQFAGTMGSVGTHSMQGDSEIMREEQEERQRQRQRQR